MEPVQKHLKKRAPDEQHLRRMESRLQHPRGRTKPKILRINRCDPKGLRACAPGSRRQSEWATYKATGIRRQVQSYNTNLTNLCIQYNNHVWANNIYEYLRRISHNVRYHN